MEPRRVTIFLKEPLQGASEAMAAAAGVDMSEFVRRLLTRAAEDAGLLDAFGRPKSVKTADAPALTEG